MENDGRQSERRQVAKGSSPTQTHRDPLGSTKKEEKKNRAGQGDNLQPGDRA